MLLVAVAAVAAGLDWRLFVRGLVEVVSHFEERMIGCVKVLGL